MLPSLGVPTASPHSRTRGLFGVGPDPSRPTKQIDAPPRAPATCLEGPHNSPVARGYARYVLAVMVGINFLNYMDRYVAAVASPLIQKEFSLSNGDIGLLASAFLLVYAVAALPFGYWADRGVRRTVVGI